MVEMMPARKAGLMVSPGCLIFRIWCTDSMKSTRKAWPQDRSSLRVPLGAVERRSGTRSCPKRLPPGDRRMVPPDPERPAVALRAPSRPPLKPHGLGTGPTSVRHVDDHNVQARDAVEVPDVGCSDAPSSGDGGGRDEPVVSPYVYPRQGQPCPKPRVCARCQQIEGERRKRGQDPLDEGFPACAVLRRCPLHSMQQFRRRNGSDPYLFGGPELLFQALADLVHRARCGQAADAAL